MADGSVVKLSQIVDRALHDDAYAERLFNEPDAIAAEHQLSGAERLVLKQMNRQQFESARHDAATRSGSGELTDEALASVSGGAGFGMAAKMILGRSITAATGGSAPLAGADCGCCGWKGSINMGALILPA
jgi:hypothetical protein